MKWQNNFLAKLIQQLLTDIKSQTTLHMPQFSSFIHNSMLSLIEALAEKCTLGSEKPVRLI